MDLTRRIGSLTDKLKDHPLFKATDYRVARSRRELEKAYALVYQEYLKRDYINEVESGWRISLHNAMPETTTFVGIMEEEVLATVSIIPDSPLGLPMDCIYREELNQFRAQKKKICEISMLASISFSNL